MNRCKLHVRLPWACPSLFLFEEPALGSLNLSVSVSGAEGNYPSALAQDLMEAEEAVPLCDGEETSEPLT